MRKTIRISLCTLLTVFAGIWSATAQNNVPSRAVDGKDMTIQVIDTLNIPEGYELVDSVIYIQNDVMDTSLVGKNIFQVLLEKGDRKNGRADVRQSFDIANSFSKYVQSNGTRQIPGYRVRIYFDNSQSSRAESENILRSFRLLHHDIRAYRSYVNPYFKVTVGDFRTRSEAMDFLEDIRSEFPSAFVVKEPVNYPVIDKTKPVIADTIQVLRPLEPVEQL